MTRLIDNLEKRNLVVRVSDPSDRRINLIHLTKEGVGLKQKTTDVVQKIVDKSLNNITEKELSMGRDVLLRIMRNLND